MAEAKKFKIILGEDDQFISRAYQDGLKRAGFEVIPAFDGNEVLSNLEKELPDLILLDIIMPEKNGFETMEEIQKNPKYKKVPVIFLSNLGQETDIEKGKAMGARDYLIKANFSIKEVVEKINEYLKS